MSPRTFVVKSTRKGELGMQVVTGDAMVGTGSMRMLGFIQTSKQNKEVSSMKVENNINDIDDLVFYDQEFYVSER